MKLNDIYKLAKAIEDTLPDIAKENNGQNIRFDTEVSIKVTPRELDGINRELYLEMNKDLYGYEESDEVIVEVFGIKFVITKKQN
jgi:hypothetical protein